MSNEKLTEDQTQTTQDIYGIKCRYVSKKKSCSGCFEFNEGLGLGDYPVDKENNCHIGSGCDECNQTGLVDDGYHTPVNEEDNEVFYQRQSDDYFSTIAEEDNEEWHNRMVNEYSKEDSDNI